MLALIDAHQIGLHHTGNETWARNIVSEFEKAHPGYAAYVVTAEGRDRLPAPIPDARLDIVSGSSSRRLLFDLPFAIRRRQPDVLLCQYTLPPTRIPSVVAVHDLSFASSEARRWLSLAEIVRYRATILTSMRRARVIVACSEWTKRDMVENHGIDADKVVVAPLALDQTLVVPPKPTDPAGFGTILVVGNVLPRKNIRIVADAVARLRAAGNDVRLRVVGSVPHHMEHEAQRILAQLGHQATFTGHVGIDELALEYSRADVVCLASHFEGFGLPLLEAMAFGRPVISSNATCLPEVGGDAALYADPEDADAWARAILDVLSNTTLRHRLIEAGYERVQGFSWRSTAASVMKALETAAS